jgi:hypothetical protein
VIGVMKRTLENEIRFEAFDKVFRGHFDEFAIVHAAAA